MTRLLSRRHFLASAAALSAAPFIAASPLGAGMARAGQARELFVERRTLEVRGRPASVFGLRRADGGSGLVLDPGEAFRLRLHNRLDVETIVHWHGQTPPPDQDGVTNTGYVAPIAAGTAADYDFVARPGTHWMHSHHGLQEMNLLAAPLIVRSAADAALDAQEVTLLLHDFSFRSPEEILAGLGGAMGHGDMGHGATDDGAMDQGTMNHGAMGQGAMNHGAMNHGSGGMDLNDVEFDAYLANDRTLDDPEVVRVERGGRVRLRLINGASGTAFWIDFGGIQASLIAVDGNAVTPLPVGRLPLAQGQRADFLIEVAAGGTVPVLAQREGDRVRTGIVLAAPGAPVTKIDGSAETIAPPADLSVERRLVAGEALAERPAAVTRQIRLTGAMMPYVWTLDGRSWADRVPVEAAAGQRVVIEMVNESMMAHPMHLHGHHFDVVSIDGIPLRGARRDTVLVPIGGRVGIAFDADNPGRWLFHCHNLLHMATGMMTEVVYA